MQGRNGWPADQRLSLLDRRHRNGGLRRLAEGGAELRRETSRSRCGLEPPGRGRGGRVADGEPGERRAILRHREALIGLSEDGALAA